jgi:ubiquinone/menaquinone biosynthesis C-methylase UbiE
LLFFLRYNVTMFSDPDKNLAQLGLSEGMKVADLGAGTGYYSIAAGRRVGNGGRVYAVEVQKDLLDRLKSNAISEKVHNVEVVWGSIDTIGGTKLREGMIDRAILASTLFQIEQKDRDNLALEIKRILKVGGKLLVVDWLPGSPLSPKNCIPRMIAENLFNKSGFSLEKSFNAGDHHYGLIFVGN